MSEVYPDVMDTKRRGPRPLNRAIDKKAQELAERTVLPDPPGKTISFDQMQEYFALLTPDMWSHAIVYLYRTRPRIIRQLKDAESHNYIDVVSQPLTMEYLIDRHGGGRYQVEMTNTDIPNAKGGPPQPNRGHLFRCNFEIDEVRYPPKLDYEELDLNHKDNMSYVALLKHRGILGADGKPIKPGQPASNGAAAGGMGINTEGLKEILGFVTTMTTAQQAALRQRLAPNEDESSLSKSLGTILVERMRQDNPSTQMQSLQTLITAVKEIVASSKPADSNTSMYGPLITMLGEQNKTLMGMMERIANPRGGGDTHGGDEMTRFNSMLDMVSKVSELTGRGGRRSGWDVGLDYVREIVPPVMGTLQQILPWMRRGPTAAPAAAGQTAPAMPAVFDPYQNPAAMRAYSEQMRNPPPATAQPQPGAPGTAAAPGPPPPSELAGVLRQYSAIVVNAMNNGTDGADFADWLTGLLGAQTHALLSQPGEEILTGTMMQIPEIAIFGAVKLRAFAHNFCHYEEVLDAREKQGDGGGDGAQAVS